MIFLYLCYYPERYANPMDMNMDKQNWTDHKIESIVCLIQYYQLYVNIVPFFLIYFNADSGYTPSVFWRLLFLADQYQVKNVLSVLIEHGSIFREFYTVTDQLKRSRSNRILASIVSEDTKLRLAIATAEASQRECQEPREFTTRERKRRAAEPETTDTGISVPLPIPLFFSSKPTSKDAFADLKQRLEILMKRTETKRNEMKRN